MKAWTKVKILDDKISLLQSPHLNSPLVGEITDHPECELASASPGFVELKIADGRHGFVDGKVRIFQPQTMTMTEDQVPIFAEPSANSTIVKLLAKSSAVRATDLVERDGVKWVQISASGGTSGFIAADTKVAGTTRPPRIEREVKDGAKTLIYGVVVCVIGVGVTAATYSAASERGGTYFVAYGAIAVGGIRIVQGLFQILMTAAAK